MRAEEEEEENKFRKEKKEGDKEKASSESKGEKEGSDDVAGKQKIIKPPKDEKCENLLEEKACSAFEPLCGMFKLRAFVLCKKTCKLCPEDKPKGISKPQTYRHLQLTDQEANKIMKSPLLFSSSR